MGVITGKLSYMNMNRKYRKTMLACYIGFITQAITANFAPLLFVTFHKTYGISFGKIAVISTVFFLTQLTVDALCARFMKEGWYRGCIVASEVCSAAGLIGLAMLPGICPSPMTGILLSVIIYAVGSGLIEVLGSPIVEACPSEHKEATMSLLHSFYCWGSVGVILFSTLFFAVFGIQNWKWLSCLWALIPLCNIYNFATCPIEHLVEEGEGMRIKSLLTQPIFWLAVLLMICSGASELTMSQWASAYAETAIGMSKTAGDLAGPCMFAVIMGVSRVWYGKYGQKVDLTKFMLDSGILCLLCYILASVSTIPLLGLTGCILCGFSVGIMWPGTISISSGRFPRGGTAMFALLAMAGDFGGAFGPGIAGAIAQGTNDNLRLGMRVGCIFPLLLILTLILFKRGTKKAK